MPHTKKSQLPSHTPGTNRGEEVRSSKGPEPGRENDPPRRVDKFTIDLKTHRVR